MTRGKKLSFEVRYILAGLKLVWQIIPLLRLTFFVFVFSFSVFTAVKSFVSLPQAASLLHSGHTQAPRRIIPGMVILLTQDSIRVLLYRHVIITMQDETTMTGTRVSIIACTADIIWITQVQSQLLSVRPFVTFSL